MEQINKTEIDNQKKPDVVIDFIRHGQAKYTDQEIQSGELQGELTEKGLQQVEDASINELAANIDPSRELIVMWSSPRNRAVQTAGIIENQLASVGIVPIRTSVKKSLSDVQLFGYSDDIDKIMQENKDKYWMEVWRNLENLPEEVESPEGVKRRTNRLIAYINRAADTVNPAGGKKLHFILIGHEETLQDLLEETFDIGSSEGEGQANGEVVRMGLYKGVEGQNPKLSVSFRGENKLVEFNPAKREVLAA